MRTMLRRLLSFGRPAEEPARDRWVEDSLASLDPERSRPTYWLEFQRGVMRSAGAELARRRRLAEVTVSDVVFSWSRTLVPAAALASLLAFLALRSVSVETPAPLRLEELLWEGADVSASSVSEELAVEISFAVDVY